MQQMAHAALLALLAVVSLASTTRTSDIRLPGSVWPLRYDLQIFTSVCEEDSNFVFQGQVDIQVAVKEPTSIIKINVRELNITFSGTSLRPIDSDILIPLTSQDIDEEHEFLILQFAQTLCVDCVYLLHIQFDGILSTRLDGFYRSKYIDNKNGKIKWVAVTQFQATEARRAFPCFDEPEYKAVFKISLGHPKTCSALSNMPLVYSQEIPGHPGWVMDEFDLTPRMSTYLVAWVISEYQCVNAPTGGKIRVCAREDALEQTKLAVTVGPLSLQYYEKYFDVIYPLPKSDMLAIPDFNAGAMENWGLITYREAYVLYDANSSTLRAKHAVASVISHELAHQWFGNLVTLKWWSDLWLNEGFATFVAALGVHNAFPHWNSRDVEAMEEIISVFSLDGLAASHPVSANINHPKEISQIFDVISYKKGSLLLRMMGLFLGEEVFRQGVINYLQRYQYGNAEKDDLYRELTTEALRQRVIKRDFSLKDVMDTWTVQTGYPVVTVHREGTSLILNQKRFLFYRASRARFASTNLTSWFIPITFTTETEKDFFRTTPNAWMTRDQPELKLSNVAKEDEWYILNIQAAGIFRVNYDTENWKLLSKTLNSRHYKNIAPMNRMQIVNDIMNFAWTADVEAEIAFKVISYLRRETEYLPWRVAFENFDRLNRIFMRTADHNTFMRWVRRLLKPAFERTGSPDPEDYHETLHHEQLVKWACHMQLETCLYQARTLFSQWMQTQNPARNDVIPVPVRSITVCMGVKYGGEQEWNFAWNYYLASNDITVKVEFLKALGCSGQSWILRRYLQWILEERGIRKQDATHVFMSVVSNEVGYPLAKEFFMTKIVELTNMYGSRNTHFSRWIKGMAQMMFTDEEYEEFTYFTDANKKYLEGSDMAVSQSKETIKDNIHWYKRNYQQYVSVLEKLKSNKVTKI